METLTIAAEGKNIDTPRDMTRLLLEVETESMNGCDIEGHYCRRGKTRIEVYSDRLDAVMKRVRNAQHLEALRVAEGIAAEMQQRWLEETQGRNLPRLNEEQRAKLIAEACPHTRWTVLDQTMPGMKGGMPPLTSIAIVDRDGIAHPIEDCQIDPKLFLRDPPATIENRARMVAQQQADAFAAGMEKLIEKLDSRSERKRQS